MDWKSSVCQSNIVNACFSRHSMYLITQYLRGTAKPLLLFLFSISYSISSHLSAAQLKIIWNFTEEVSQKKFHNGFKF